MPEVHINSNFSIETNLAEELRAWPEFRSGDGYNVSLVPSCDERVSVELVESKEDGLSYIRIVASLDGPLFERVLGRAAYVLAGNSDHLMIRRRK